jgi:cytochrome oxidase Cu insertion factor (SCO1/SenC/PrrC family)
MKPVMQSIRSLLTRLKPLYLMFGFTLLAGAAAEPALAAAEPTVALEQAASTQATAELTERELKAREYFSDRPLVDQDGQQHRFFSDLLRGHIVVLNVVFTHCEDACPLMTKRLLGVSREVGDRFGQDVRFISVSVDPQRDTPERLKAFAVEQGADLPGWRFVTGNADDSQYILGRLGQWSDDENDHSTLLLVGNASQARWSKIPPQATSAQIITKIDEFRQVR